MYNKTFKFKNAQGTSFVYQRGSQVIFQGKVYNCLQDTNKTPFQDPTRWKFIGLTETYYGDTPPLKPYPNQTWISSSGIMYTYINDGNSTQWIQF
jgi:hypothetical protein